MKKKNEMAENKDGGKKVGRNDRKIEKCKNKFNGKIWPKNGKN